MDMSKLAEQLAKKNQGSFSTQNSLKISTPEIVKPKLVMPLVKDLLTNADMNLPPIKVKIPTNPIETAAKALVESPTPKNNSNFKIPAAVWWGVGIGALGTGIYIGVKEYKKYKIRKEQREKDNFN